MTPVFFLFCFFLCLFEFSFHAESKYGSENLNFFQKKFEKFDRLSADQLSRAVETVNEVVIVNCHSR